MLTIDILQWIATFLSILGIYLNAKKNILCWGIWQISNVFWIIVALITNNIPQLVLWIVFLFSNWYGYRQWTKEEVKSDTRPMVDGEYLVYPNSGFWGCKQSDLPKFLADPKSVTMYNIPVTKNYPKD